jgi:hypothetical protein
MGTWALYPRSMMKLACMELRGPMMACTSTIFIKSRAVFEKKKKKKKKLQFNAHSNSN